MINITDFPITQYLNYIRYYIISKVWEHALQTIVLCEDVVHPINTGDTPMSQLSYESLSQRAYHAYGSITNFKNFRGESMPAWDDLPAPIKDAWKAAVSEVASIAVEDPTAMAHLVDTEIPPIVINA